MWKTICDWCWWTFIIRRNEFHHSLNLNHADILDGKTTLHLETMRIVRERDRAHKLDMKWG